MADGPVLKTDLYAQRRGEILARYTPRIKALSPQDPEYRSLWESRAASLRALRTEFYPPEEGI